jgi:hypothetical protein
MMKKKNISLVKFTVVAAMVGFFSPSVNVKTNVQSLNSYNTAPLQWSVSLLNTAEARGRGGGRGGARGGSAHRGGSANRGGSRARSRPSTRPSTRPANRPAKRPSTRPVDRNVNRNVNVNVNNRYYGGYGHGYGYYGDRAIYGFAAGLVIGSMVAAATIPTTCTTVVANGVSYRQCGSSYYQPFYQGDTLVYKVVASPY